MGKDKKEILKSLENNIPSEMKNNMELQPLKKEPTQERLISDTEEDFELARNQIKSLIDTSGEAIEQMHNLAADAEHPRAFEVLGALIKQTAEMNGQLLDLQKQRKALIKDENKAASTTTNNSIFVGTTTELQNLLKGDDNADNIIEVD